MPVCQTDRAAESAKADVREASVQPGNMADRLQRVVRAALGSDEESPAADSGTVAPAADGVSENPAAVGGEAPMPERPPPEPPAATPAVVDAVTAAREQAEAIRRAKALFLTNMSHELRTPMHAVLSYAQLGRDATSQSEQVEYFERIQERGLALLRTLNDIVELSRLESGTATLGLASHDIEALLQSALVAAQAQFLSKNLHVEYQRSSDIGRARAFVDSIRICHVFGELIDNAVRYSPEGAHVRVFLSATTLPACPPPLGSGQPRPAIELAITDEGVGIPPDELQQIFDKFVKSSKTRNNSGGTGLGLALCREIVALHQGAIWASNNAGPGTTFCVVLPLMATETGSGGHA
jgi:signal transduction histidine kinase